MGTRGSHWSPATKRRPYLKQLIKKLILWDNYSELILKQLQSPRSWDISSRILSRSFRAQGQPCIRIKVWLKACILPTQKPVQCKSIASVINYLNVVVIFYFIYKNTIARGFFLHTRSIVTKIHCERVCLISRVSVNVLNKSRPSVFLSQHFRLGEMHEALPPCQSDVCIGIWQNIILSLRRYVIFLYR